MRRPLAHLYNLPFLNQSNIQPGPRRTQCPRPSPVTMRTIRCSSSLSLWLAGDAQHLDIRATLVPLNKAAEQAVSKRSLEREVSA